MTKFEDDNKKFFWLVVKVSLGVLCFLIGWWILIEVIKHKS